MTPRLAVPLLIAVWLACGAVSYAGMNAYWWGQFPSLRSERHDRQDMGDDFPLVFFGPISLISAAITTGMFADGFAWSPTPTPDKKACQ